MCCPVNRLEARGMPPSAALGGQHEGWGCRGDSVRNRLSIATTSLEIAVRGIVLRSGWESISNGVLGLGFRGTRFSQPEWTLFHRTRNARGNNFVRASLA